MSFDELCGVAYEQEIFDFPALFEFARTIEETPEGRSTESVLRLQERLQRIADICHVSRDNLVPGEVCDLIWNKMIREDRLVRLFSHLEWMENAWEPKELSKLYILALLTRDLLDPVR